LFDACQDSCNPFVSRIIGDQCYCLTKEGSYTKPTTTVEP
jgi:hypothetical protein